LIFPAGAEVSWTFTATAGERLVLRVATFTSTNSFNAWMRLYGPDGVLLDSASSSVSVDEIAITAVQSGTYTVLIGDGIGSGNSFAGTGRYGLQLLQFPGAFVVADDGGALTNGVNHDGLIHFGDLDAWTFIGCRGDRVTLQVSTLTVTNSFSPWMRFYGPDGTLITSGSSSSAQTQYAVTLASTGPFTLLVSDGIGSGNSFNGTGRYRITATGILTGLTLCKPQRNGGNLVFNGAGGTPGALFVVLTATDVTAPLNLWQPIQTNSFGTFGEFTFTNTIDANVLEQYFRLRTP
jgi:hypothetical protein